MHGTTGETWKTCNADVAGNYTFDLVEGSTKKIESLLGKVKIWIYSGDKSASAPTLGTLGWLQSLAETKGLRVRNPFRVWWIENAEVNVD